MELIGTIPGIARRTAEIIVSEIGTDMSRFPSAEHLAAWAGVAPGNYESGGKKRAEKSLDQVNWGVWVRAYSGSRFGEVR